MRLDARESETGTAKGSMTDFDEYYEAAEPGRRERALGWATAIGLQDGEWRFVEMTEGSHG